MNITQVADSQLARCAICQSTIVDLSIFPLFQNKINVSLYIYTENIKANYCDPSDANDINDSSDTNRK